MSIVRHSIVKRVRPDTSFALPGLVDFELGPAEIVEASVLSRGDVAPWGLDVVSGSVILLDFTDARALRSAVFTYQEQAAQATSVFLVPSAELCEAFGADRHATGGPPVFLHSVGRCGSTLLAQRLAALPGMCCLSEPDVYTAIQTAVESGALGVALAIELLRAATHLLATNVAGEDTLVVKTRAEVCRIWPLFDAAFPDARSLFLYRDAALVVQSFDRILGYPHGRSQALPERDAVFDRQLPAYEAALRTRFFARESAHAAISQRECGPWAGLLVAEWHDKVLAYLAARGRAPERVFALRYEDLVDHHEAVLHDVARFLGSASPGVVALPTADSQEGTLLEAVETLLHPLDADTLAGIERAGRVVLGEHATAPLPGTWAAF